MRLARTAAGALAALALLGSPARSATLDTVKERGILRCGMPQPLQGISQTDASGAATGIDADLCRAIAAAVLKAPEAVQAGAPLLPLVVGVTAAALSSWLAIAVLLRFVARHSYGVFALYRVVLGVTVLALLVTRG